MIKNVLTLLLISFSVFGFAQKEINAKINIDEKANLKITQYFKKTSNDTLQFGKEIALDPNFATKINTHSSDFYNYEIQNKDSLNIEIKHPEKPIKNHIITDDYLFTSLKYLGIIKKRTERKLNLDIHSKKFKVIFPTKEDLEKKYVTIPPIVAGDFESFDSNGFQIYYLKKHKDSLENFQRASNSMQKSFDFYKGIFGAQPKPKIVFAPFSGPSSASENLIVYNMNQGLPNTISHEMAHIWFGHDGKTFSEISVTEGMAEFLSLLYLQKISNFGKENFDSFIKTKFHRIEGLKSFKRLSDKNFDRKDKDFIKFSYDLLALFLLTKQNNNPNFVNQIADFYQYKKKDETTSLDEMNYYFITNKLEPLFTVPILPDYFIEECADSKVCITSNSIDNLDLEIEITDDDNQKTIKTLSFSKDQKQQILDIGNSEKITIDPDFKILQITRLNDIWNKNDPNIFNKNRYTTLQELKPELAEISQDVLAFLKNPESKEISKNLVVTEGQNTEFVNARKQFFDSKKNKINGASALYQKSSKTLFIHLSYLNETTMNADVLILKLILNDDLKTLNKLFIEEEN